jgi:hypothetical protein
MFSGLFCHTLILNPNQPFGKHAFFENQADQTLFYKHLLNHAPVVRPDKI